MREATVTIDRLAAGGDGVGHLDDGRVVFVPSTAPGDRVVVRISELRRRFARGELLEVEMPGASRREPRCEYFGRCGGCAWQHIDYRTQLEAKREILGDALARIGGVALAGQIRVTPSPDEYGYRTRARVHAKNGSVGYRERKSHSICPIDHCPVLAPALDHQLAALAARVREAEIDDEAGEWELRVGEDGTAQANRLDGASTHARDRLRLRAGEEMLELSIGSFSQSNGLLHDALRDAVIDCAVGAGTSLLELHSGVGFFTLSLARHYGEMHAVESSPVAVRDLRRNLRDAGLRHVRVTQGAVEPLLATGSDLSCDVVLLDPPRTGLADAGATHLASLGASRILYLSCDPATLARDVRVLSKHGYAVTSVQAFDLFPQTPHIEALVVLEIV
jgi:23S rRNA (uracil1939-C5)-methyltransferase